MTEEVIKVFKRSEYGDPPSAHIQSVLDKLWVLGPAVIADRHTYTSDNIVGTVHRGLDGDQPVLRGKPAFPGECSCHIHTKWRYICDSALVREDVGNGVAEPAIHLLDKDGESVIRIFYPAKTYEEVAAVLAAPPVPRPEPTSAFWYIFKVVFPSKEALESYIEFWGTVSKIIQQETGARGTRLLRIRGSEYAVMALPEWETSDARIAAYQRLNEKMDIDELVAARIAALGGKAEIIAQADEIAAVF